MADYPAPSSDWRTNITFNPAYFITSSQVSLTQADGDDRYIKRNSGIANTQTTFTGGLQSSAAIETDTLSDNGAGFITTTTALLPNVNDGFNIGAPSLAFANVFGTQLRGNTINTLSGSGTITFSGVDSLTTLLVDNQTTLYPTLRSTVASSSTTLQLSGAGDVDIVIDDNNTGAADNSFRVRKNGLNGTGSEMFRLRDNSGTNTCTITGATTLGGTGITTPLTMDANGRELVFINAGQAEFRCVSADNNLIDLGNSAAVWRNCYLGGTLFVNTVNPRSGTLTTFSNDLTVTGTLTVGAFTIANAEFEVAMTAQTISNITPTTLTNYGTPSTNTGFTSFTSGVLTIATSGKYTISATVGFDTGSTAGSRAVAIYKNGSTLLSENVCADSGTSTSGGTTFCASTFTTKLVATDTLEIKVEQSSGSNRTIQTTSRFTCFFVA